MAVADKEKTRILGVKELDKMFKQLPKQIKQAKTSCLKLYRLIIRDIIAHYLDTFNQCNFNNLNIRSRFSDSYYRR